MKKNVLAYGVTAAAAVVLAAGSAFAAQVPTIVYDNSVNPLNKYFASQSEFGDQIASPAIGWLMDTFTFEYFASGLGGNEKATLRFYANDGAGEGNFKAPGSLLYTSPEIPLFNGNSPVTVADLKALNLVIPPSFTWTVSVSGLAPAETFGLKLYDPPVVGTSYDDIWQLNNGNWQLIKVDGVAHSNFGSQLIAVVPEPGTLSLFGLGALALVARRRAAK